ncbi:hypothetical protein LV82_00140 [Albidovulum inexpectatum]|uniref:TrbM protein n=1 Tax=Albidovulum inexpectatum TaxID=196587 RepID=A0A2S5JLU5_9RHOB|nr:hypothetical protein [Albidovulum inexpectatum]PPB82215.1 hypothetical protein LV82_00140 [Albidovulum inexpectatum]
MKYLYLATAVLALSPAAADAGAIESACQRAGKPVSRALCSCIQSVADRTLSRSDQKLAAKLLRDPDKADEIRASRRNSHKAFWERYRAFGSRAEQTCS